MKINHLLSLLALGAVSFAQAQLVVYTFDGVTDPVDNNAVVIPAATAAASVTTGGITGAGGLGLYRIRNPNGAYDSSVLLTDNSTGDADAAAAFAAGGYFSFTLTPTVADLDLGSLDFLVRLPGRIPAGLVVDGIGSGIDLLPTLLGLAGGELPPATPILSIAVPPSVPAPAG